MIDSDICKKSFLRTGGLFPQLPYEEDYNPQALEKQNIYE